MIEVILLGFAYVLTMVMAAGCFFYHYFCCDYKATGGEERLIWWVETYTNIVSFFVALMTFTLFLKFATYGGLALSLFVVMITAHTLAIRYATKHFQELLIIFILRLFSPS